MIPRILVITPPSGPVEPTVIELAVSLDIELAVLLRDAVPFPRSCVDPNGRLAPIRTAAVRAGFRVLLSCGAEQATEVVADARNYGLSGLQLKGDPSPSTLLRARAAWPTGILGASVHGAPRPVAADYVVFAPVFPPRTPGATAKHAVGIAPLRAWADEHPRTFALGGIDARNASDCIHAGAFGIAGISTFLGVRDTVADTLRALVSTLTLESNVSQSSRG